MIKKLKCGVFINTNNYSFYRVEEDNIEFVYEVLSKGKGESYHLVISLQATEDEIIGETNGRET